MLAAGIAASRVLGVPGAAGRLSLHREQHEPQLPGHGAGAAPRGRRARLASNKGRQLGWRRAPADLGRDLPHQRLGRRPGRRPARRPAQLRPGRRGVAARRCNRSRKHCGCASMRDRPFRVAVDARSLNTEHLRGIGKSVFELIKRTAASGAVDWHLLADRPDRPMQVADPDACRGVGLRNARRSLSRVGAVVAAPARAAARRGPAARARNVDAVVAAGADGRHHSRHHSVAATRPGVAARFLSRSAVAGGLSSRRGHHDRQRVLAPRHPRAMAAPAAEAARRSRPASTNATSTPCPIGGRLSSAIAS